MRQVICISIYIIFSFFHSQAQIVSDFTISSCSFNTNVLTGTIGETGISNVSTDHSSIAGFIEVLLAEVIELPPADEPEIDEPKIDEPEIPEAPTGTEQIEESVKIGVTKQLLQIDCSVPHVLTIYKLSGEMVIKECIELNYTHSLPTGIYVITLQNKTERKVYKVSIQ